MPWPEGPPPTPSHPFRRSVAPALDRARAKIAEVGLRPYLVYRVLREWDGGERGAGGIARYVWDALEPRPRVRPLSTYKIAASGGLYQTGDVELYGVSVVAYRKEWLRGKTEEGDNLPKHQEVFYLVLPEGEPLGQAYNVAAEPVLRPTEWVLLLRARNERLPGPGPT